MGRDGGGGEVREGHHAIISLQRTVSLIIHTMEVLRGGTALFTDCRTVLSRPWIDLIGRNAVFMGRKLTQDEKE